MSSFQDFFLGSPARERQLQTLTPQQQGLFQMLQSVLQGGQASGPFAGAIQNLLQMASGDPQATQQFEAPLQRQFQEETIPGLAAQFAGMGSGGAFSGSGFRNAALREGSNLQERLGALRGGLQMQAAGQLPGFFSQATQPQFQPALTQPTQGLFAGIGQGFGQGVGRAFSGGF